MIKGVNIVLLVAALLCLAMPACPAAPEEAIAEDRSEGPIYVIPVEGAIMPGMLYIMRRGLAEAVREDARAVILHMNTPGGAVKVAEEMIRMLIGLPPEIEVYTYVDKDALSAGAFIALATDEIYMAEGSRIGASAVVTFFGDLPDGDMKEKMVSSVVALVSSAAEKRGHDVRLVEPMIRPDAPTFSIGDKVISEEGRLLTMNEYQASELVEINGEKRPILSSGTVENFQEFLRTIGQGNSKLIELTTTWSEDVALWIERLSALLLIGGLLGIYIEFKTPGFGVPGLVGILLLIVFFWGHNIAGLAGSEELILFILGLVLLGVELFVTPGFGVLGGTGIVMMAVSMILAMVQHYPGLPYYDIPAGQLQRALFTFVAGLGGTGLFALAIARFLPETTVFQRVVLTESETPQQGFASSADHHELVSARGVAVTPLRPSGTAMIGDERVSVVARGEFIDKGADIVVAEVKGNHIVVDKADA